MEVTLKAMLPVGDNREIIEGIISGLVMRLLRRMCNGSHADGNSSVILIYVTSSLTCLLQDVQFVLLFYQSASGSSLEGWAS